MSFLSTVTCRPAVISFKLKHNWPGFAASNFVIFLYSKHIRLALRVRITVSC